MTLTHRVSDRRTTPRYEIVGTLRSMLVTHEDLSLDNLSAGGFSFAMAEPLAVDSIHSLRLDAPGAVIDVYVRVRYCTPLGDPGRYAIGVELLRPLPPALVHRVDPTPSDSTDPS